MIHIGLSPNLRFEDSLLALKLIFKPWIWKEGRAINLLEDWFKKNIGVDEAIAFNSGRSAQYAILKALGIKKGDEVLLQAFTCVAVPNSILWTGAKPIYVDVGDDLNMDQADLEKKISSKSRAIIVQHTFGKIAKLDEICQIAKKHKLTVIEDCAHMIKKEIQGDFAFYSFGRDKAISGVFGGMAVINQRSEIKDKRLREIQEKLFYPTYYWIFQQLLHPVASAIILPLYDIGIGKLILWSLQKWRLLSFPVQPEEKEGFQPKDFPKKMPNALAQLTLAQLDDLAEFEEKRKRIAGIYNQELEELKKRGKIKLTDGYIGNIVPLLRYSILTDKAKELRQFAKKRSVILGNWYSNIIDPGGVNYEKIGYQLGSCPVAEQMSSQIVNLPTYPRMTDIDATKVIGVIEEFFGIT